MTCDCHILLRIVTGADSYAMPDVFLSPLSSSLSAACPPWLDTLSKESFNVSVALMNNK